MQQLCHCPPHLQGRKFCHHWTARPFSDGGGRRSQPLVVKTDGGKACLSHCTLRRATGTCHRWHAVGGNGKGCLPLPGGRPEWPLVKWTASCCHCCHPSGHVSHRHQTVTQTSWTWRGRARRRLSVGLVARHHWQGAPPLDRRWRGTAALIMDRGDHVARHLRAIDVVAGPGPVIFSMSLGKNESNDDDAGYRTQRLSNNEVLQADSRQAGFSHVWPTRFSSSATNSRSMGKKMPRRLTPRARRKVLMRDPKLAFMRPLSSQTVWRSKRSGS